MQCLLDEKNGELSNHEMKENPKLNQNTIAEFIQNKRINPKLFCTFMLVDNMGATFQDDVRKDDNEKVDDNMFTLGDRKTFCEKIALKTFHKVVLRKCT
jgi:hypothetical protein